MGKELIDVFSNNLRKIMSNREVTQTDLARYMEVSSATASDWCNGKKMPRANKLQSLANWLNVELSDLLEDKDEIGITAKLTNLEEELLDMYRALPPSYKHLVEEFIESCYMTAGGDF